MFIKCTCKHCGGPIEIDHEDAGRVADCPHCGQKTFLSARTGAAVPGPPLRSRKPKGGSGPMLGCVGVLALILLFVFVLSSLTPKEGGRGSSSSVQKTMDVELRYVGDTLLVENKSPEDWSGVTAYINDTPPYGYKCVIGYIKTKEVKAVSLAEFSKKDGQRFNPEAFKITEIWIGGGEYDYKAYRGR